MGDDKLPAFTVGDWQARQARPTSTPKKEEEERIRYGKTYPSFGQYLNAQDFSPIFGKCEHTCTELDRLVRVGTQEVAQEAQLALNAYGRAMQLAGELLELRLKFRNR